MSLRIIRGSADKARSKFVLNEIRDKLKRNPFGKPIFYIVPEQMTFQQEYHLFGDVVRGSSRAQVMSFSRLAWRVMQESGGSTRQFISSTGTQMMLRKVIEQKTDGFHVFQKASDKYGFLKELDGMITEFKRHRVTPDMLKEQIDYAEENIALKNKLEDLHYIYDALAHLFADKYLDGEDQLEMLIEKIVETSLFNGAEILIDGFHRFTPKELAVISELMKVTNRVSVNLTINHASDDSEIDELDLFYQTKRTYNQLKELANEHHILIEEDEVLTDKHSRFASVPHLLHMEKYFDDRPAPALTGVHDNPVRVMEAVHPRAELEGVIQEILRLTREEDYRYRDIVIYLRDAENYHDLIATLFRDYDIPVFFDEKKTMLNHPFIEFIRSLFDVVASNWRYDAMFRLLKTGLIPKTDEKYPLDRNAIDELENYVLEYGIRSKSMWLDQKPWYFQRFKGFDTQVQTDAEKNQEIKMNAWRKQVTDALKDFDALINREDTVKHYCEVLFELFEALDIPSQLEENRRYYDETDQVEKAREEEQVWQSIIQTLDEAVEMIGEEVMSFRMFQETLEAGMEALEFSHVPPTMDHVIVGSIDHSRIDNKKCSFLLGVNEGLWPMKPPIDGIINEQEREYLYRFGMELAASNRRVLLDDHFYMYLAFTTATEYVWVSYPISDSEGNGRLPAQIIQRLYEFFPDMEAPVLLSEPDELNEASRFITTPEKTRAPLTVQLSRQLRGYPMQDIWLDVLAWYMKNETKDETAYKVLQSLFYENKPSNLSNETVKQLYPKEKPVSMSVSRLERLNSCKYQHFAKHNLALENRRTYKLEAPDIGQLFHEAIKIITEWIQVERNDFKGLTKEDAKQYANRSIEHLAPIMQHQILTSSNRYKYLQRKLSSIIARTTYILSEQARLSGFSPVGMELAFGMKGGLDPLKIELPNGFELHLRGQIDRVDQAREGEQLYLRIIDYKSSNQDLSLQKVYYGLSLQMLAYLQVVLARAEEWLGLAAEPAGVLYFHIHNAMLTEKSLLSDEKITDALFKKYKMNGLVMADEQVARLMDTSLETGRSDIVPIGLKKNGELRSDSNAASLATFQLLEDYLEQLLVDAGLNMTSGQIMLDPYEYKQRTACIFCDFKSVCQFDPTLEENDFRRLKAMKDDEVLDKMQEIR